MAAQTTTNATTTAPDGQVIATVKADISWAQHHLFLLGIVVALTIAGIYGVESLIASHDRNAYLQQQTILKQFTQQNQQIQQQTKTQIDALTAQNASLQQQFSSIAVAIANRDAQLVKQQTTIKTLPPPQLAAEWGSSANEPAPGIDVNGDFLAPLPLAQKSVDALIQVPVLTQDKKDLQTQLAAETTVASNNDQKFQAESKAHQADNDTCKQTVATKDAQIKDLKAQGRKRAILIAIISAAFGYALHK